MLEYENGWDARTVDALVVGWRFPPVKSRHPRDMRSKDLHHAGVLSPANSAEAATPVSQYKTTSPGPQHHPHINPIT